MNMFRAFMHLDKLTESSNRQMLIDNIKKLGKNYNFAAYTDAQLFRMWRRLEDAKQKKNKIEPKNVFDLEFENRGYDYCDLCGCILNELGQCPVCDLGEEDLSEGIFDTGPSNLTSWKSASGQPVNVNATVSQAGPTQPTLNINNKFVVSIVSYDGRLRARATDGVHPAAWVAFPRDLRQFEGQQYEVDQLIWNGKNYRVSGNIKEI